LIDFEKYEIVQEYEDIEMDNFVAAYVYAGVYINFKDNNPNVPRLWKMVNLICDNKYINGAVEIEEFMRDYNKGYGVYPNWNSNESRNYNIMTGDFLIL